MWHFESSTGGTKAFIDNAILLWVIGVKKNEKKEKKWWHLKIKRTCLTWVIRQHGFETTVKWEWLLVGGNEESIQQLEPCGESRAEHLLTRSKPPLHCCRDDLHSIRIPCCHLHNLPKAALLFFSANGLFGFMLHLRLLVLCFVCYESFYDVWV